MIGAMKPEASMSRGLGFLAKNQNADGSFGGIPPGAKEGDVGITALAVLAWATSPEAARKKVEGPFVKGIEFILSHQQQDGSIINVGQGLNTYKTATAILECLDLPTRAPPLAGPGVETVEFGADTPPDWEPDPIFDPEF